MSVRQSREHVAFTSRDGGERGEGGALRPTPWDPTKHINKSVYKHPQILHKGKKKKMWGRYIRALNLVMSSNWGEAVIGLNINQIWDAHG